MIHEVQELARTVRWSFNIYSIYSCQRSPFSVNVLSTGIRRCRARGAQACSWNLQATLSQDDVEASGSVSTVIHRCQGGFVKGFVLDCRLCRLLGEVCVC